LIDEDHTKFKKYLEETTPHGATGGYYQATDTGKRRLQPFSVTLKWDVAEATHAAIVAAFDSTDPIGMSIEDPDGSEVISFSAHIEEIERIVKQEEAYKAKVLIHPTGPATITP